MTIKEVSEKYQITQDTLLYYERVDKISRYEEAVQTGKLVWDEDKPLQALKN